MVIRIIRIKKRNAKFLTQTNQNQIMTSESTFSSQCVRWKLAAIHYLLKTMKILFASDERQKKISPWLTAPFTAHVHINLDKPSYLQPTYVVAIFTVLLRSAQEWIMGMNSYWPAVNWNLRVSCWFRGFRQWNLTKESRWRRAPMQLLIWVQLFPELSWKG